MLSRQEDLLKLKAAWQFILNHIHPTGTEKLSLSKCLNRILREEIRVPFDLPPFDRSAMDGYALAGETKDQSYQQTATMTAGTEILPTLQAGECARIFTGAPIPLGTDRVAIQENCRKEGKRIHVVLPVKHGSNIRFRAEDACSGDLALTEGIRLEPAQLGLAAFLGKSKLLVSKQPAVWILSTGNELIDPGHPLKPGQIYNSNGPQLAAQVLSFGGCPHVTEILGDDLPIIVRHIREAWKQKADILCISGGASVGDADYTRTALEQCGFTIHFHGIDLKPGKPTLFATNGKTLAFAVPGNPVSHLAVFALLIGPAIQSMLGLKPIRKLKAKLKESWRGKTDSRDRWLPAYVEQVEECVLLRFLPWKGSGDLFACRHANAIAHIPSKTTLLPQGTKVIYLLLDGG